MKDFILEFLKVFGFGLVLISSLLILAIPGIYFINYCFGAWNLLATVIFSVFLAALICATLEKIAD